MGMWGSLAPYFHPRERVTQHQRDEPRRAEQHRLQHESNELVDALYF
jgi:hypothetical protein